MPVYADPLSFQDRDALEGAGSEPVAAAIRYTPGAAARVRVALGQERYDEYPELYTLITYVSAKILLTASGDETVERIEIIDNAMTLRVKSLLQALRRVEAERSLFAFGALNISLGVPKAFLGLNRSGEHTVQEAISRIVQSGVPVVMSIGNDGPAEGTANPWAMAPGVIIATATDVSGQRLWSSSSRLRPDELAGRDLYAAHGYLSIGARAKGSPKTPAMLEAEREVNLPALVGAGNVEYYRVDSGTSYAAAELTHTACLVHQAVAALRLISSATDELKGVLPPFVRAYMDSGIDDTHPLFTNRLADRRHKYGGLQFEFPPERRTRLTKLALAGIVLDLHYGPKPLITLLSRAARPVPGTKPHETGHGFVSRDSTAAMLMKLKPLDLVEVFADPADPRLNQWKRVAAEDATPLFTPEDLLHFQVYCDQYDLILMLRVT